MFHVKQLLLRLLDQEQSLAKVAAFLGENQEMWADQCAKHWQLLLAWQQRSNLTAVVDPEQAVWRHYLDSIVVLPYLLPIPAITTIVDMGSGAGFPGMVVAMARPAWQVTLLEPRRKRWSFLQYAVAKLNLNNVRVICGRSDLLPPLPYAVVLTRATFASIAALAALYPWLHPLGHLWAWRQRPSGLPYCVDYTYRLKALSRNLLCMPQAVARTIALTKAVSIQPKHGEKSR